jgi:hypothetical protein
MRHIPTPVPKHERATSANSVVHDPLPAVVISWSGTSVSVVDCALSPSEKGDLAISLMSRMHKQFRQPCARLHLDRI